jgi:hypothetical protein
MNADDGTPPPFPSFCFVMPGLTRASIIQIRNAAREAMDRRVKLGDDSEKEIHVHLRSSAAKPS